MVSRAPEPTPGVLPWRPVTPAEIFVGALRCVRVSPAAMLGVAAIVASSTAGLGRGVAAGLTGLGLPPDGALTAGITDGVNVAGQIIAAGMLALVAGRAVLGDTTSFRQSWALLGPRLPALLGLAALVAVPAAAVFDGGLAALELPLRRTPGGVTEVVEILLALLLAGYGYTLLCFAPAAVVLERRSAPAAIRRAVKLSLPNSPRIFGVLVLTVIATSVLALAVSAPFTLAEHLLGAGRAATVARSAGDLFGDIAVTAFAAAVITLLYIDRRIRGEAFDARFRDAPPPPPPNGCPDDRWLPDPPR